MSEVMASEAVVQPQAYPSVFIRVLAQVTTALHFLQSLGAMIIFWLWPSLTPEPRLQRYISSTPQLHHPHRPPHHHHQHTARRRNSRKPSGSTLDGADMNIALLRVDKALEDAERPGSPVQRWEDGERTTTTHA
ncbi:hypothetical protein D9613_004208 [Agrocybe pediades]|uniref:Uncharacterized protein n=1 Tax=Agrocybe pediades TaxID=84607 RepID=A0A8H4QIE5_9AGAR|nr:hypothetical protein D9613_004208 [Agrocybe pediades]